MKCVGIFFFTAVLILVSSIAFAGWVIHYGGDSMMEPTTSYIQNNMMRQGIGSIVTIMDINREWIFYINPKNKTYWGGPASEVHKAGQAEAQKAMEDMLKNLPPEQREAIKKAMGRKGQSDEQTGFQASLDVKNTKRTAVIAGHKCRQYEVLSDGQLVMELWIAKSVSVSKELDAKKFAQMMAKLSKSGGGKSPMTSPKVQALWQEGYPLKHVIHVMGRANTMEATKVEQKSIPSELFKVPAGYKKVGFMEAMQ